MMVGGGPPVDGFSVIGTIWRHLNLEFSPTLPWDPIPRDSAFTAKPVDNSFFGDEFELCEE